MDGYAQARRRMVDAQIAARGVRDARVLAAMREVPRDEFVEAGMEEFAYEDSPLPIGAGQTISQPYIAAFMLEACRRDSVYHSRIACESRLASDRHTTRSSFR